MPSRVHARGVLPPALAARATPLLVADVYQCACPGGEDHDLYLVFDRRWRALCTHGCREGDILEAFGMPRDALHPPPLVYVSYPYHAPDGRLLFDVVRRPNRPKGPDRFMVREHARPFESSLVYRLPEMLAAPLDTPVYWTEGEKDVGALRAHGLLAVTTSDGPVPYDPRKIVWWFEGRKLCSSPTTTRRASCMLARSRRRYVG